MQCDCVITGAVRNSSALHSLPLHLSHFSICFTLLSIAKQVLHSTPRDVLTVLLF